MIITIQKYVSRSRFLSGNTCMVSVKDVLLVEESVSGGFR